MARSVATKVEKPAARAAAGRSSVPAGKGAGKKGTLKASTKGRPSVEPAAVARSLKGAAGRTAALQRVVKQPTITLKHLAAKLSESEGRPRREAESIVTGLFGQLIEQVKAGAKVRIAGLGTIELKDRPARMARNPATGAPVQVAASRKVVFRVAKDLKEAL